MDLTKEEKLIQTARAERYGEATPQHANLGLLWTAILQQHYDMVLPESIPSHIVLLMMVAHKISRAAWEKGMLKDDDNFLDGKIYFELAKNARKEYIHDQKISRRSENENS